MNHKKIDFTKVSETLERCCPFIGFALLQGPDDCGWLHRSGRLELSVFITTEINSWNALESILPVFTRAAPDTFCELILLNRVDPCTRIRVLRGKCLFVRAGMEPQYQEFFKRAWLDLRILRAHGRRKGVTSGLLPDFNERGFYGSENFFTPGRLRR